MLHPSSLHYPESLVKQITNSSQSSQQSSCSQCKRNTYKIQQESQQEEGGSLKSPQRFAYNNDNDRLQQSEDDGQMNMRRGIGERNFKFEEMLRVLQYEVDALKRENQDKDAVIKELKFLVHKSTVEEQKKMGYDKQLHEINRLRKQLGCSPRNIFSNRQKGFKSSSGLLNNQKIQGFQQDLTQSFNPNSYLPPRPKPTEQQQIQVYKTINLSKFQSLSDYQLRITFLQKQLQESQYQIIQQKQHIVKLQQDNKWQQKFIHSFVKMCDQISLTYGEKLNLNRLGDDLKKKTKFSWNYMKQLVAYFIQAIEGNIQEVG